MNVQGRHQEAFVALPGRPSRRQQPWGKLCLATLALCLLSAAWLAAATGATEPSRPGPEDRCPVCGMFVHKFPAWISLIVFTDDTRVFFDGPKDLFRYYHELAKYAPGRTDDDIAGIYVTDYYTTQPIEAREAFFVVGSDVKGPMGSELIPVGGEQAAADFRRDHRGDRVLTFEQVELSELTGLQ